MEQYESAAVRHYHDAVMLKESNRLDNAAHLIGFSAECAIKHNMMQTRPSVEKVHFPDILTVARKYSDRRSVMHNLLKKQLFKQDLLDGWQISHRYCATGHTNKKKLEKWIQDAGSLMAAANIKRRI